ncbi:sigma-54-dependent Fis family transcriptional regulator [Brevibacillus sp. SYP-B805]|uniref:sigma-54-dependent Fis family transcriptional regulator n=1 Tax=Brevibacillus sp. SYP-B805 TaxID=1578199 RepID=UPI001F49A5FE|nr:sigma-54-dependent Fis family transcriptional regulator [Brevibacillus sp. SYP-B805]
MYGVNPAKSEEAILEAAELERYRKERRQFLHSITPTLERLYGWLKTSHSMVLVSDSSGYILENMGDPAFVSDAQKVHLSKGACWAEQVKGTNAIGTVIAEKQPLAVLGTDHYCEENRFLFCAASPIFDPSGDLLAVLDISGYHKEYHPSVLAMIDVMARNVEDWLLINRPDRQVVLALYPEQDNRHPALLAVNEEGVITGANREARSLFHLHAAKLAGRPLSELITGAELLLQRSGSCSSQEVHVICKAHDRTSKLVGSLLMDTRPPLIAYREDSAKKAAKPAQTSGNSSIKYTFADIFGSDPDFQTALQLAKRAAATEYSILITGESGTGKEMVSQAIHAASPRSGRPFVALNCGAIARSLMESELFGYEAGAFTGAKQTGHPGKIEMANGGTLFLDEIAEMPPDVQVALLRVLQEFTLTRVGGVRPIQVDVRIIAATHKDLWQEVQEGRFRADLFYRLQGINIVLPPLRKRNDRLVLAEHLLETVAKELGGVALSLSQEAKKLIEQYEWPGNVRELIAALRQAAFLSQGECIGIRHFPPYILNSLAKNGEKASHSLEAVEHETILAALKAADGNIAQAARMLGIGRNTLYRKIKKIT